MAIREIDVHDDAALAAYVDTVAASARSDRARPDLRTVGELAARLRRPDPYSQAVLLAVADEDSGTDEIRYLAVAEQWWALQDNTHVVDAEIHVRPAYRRRGLGRSLHDALDRRRRALGRPVSRMEVHTPLDAGSPGLAFATALGYDDLHLEAHLLLDLADPRPSKPDPRWSSPGPRWSSRSRPPTGYRIVTWSALCPAELLPAYADLRTRMELDAPLGELDYEPVLWDEARVRTDEARTALANHAMVAAAVRTDGELAGYTLLLLPRDGDEAMQEDTLVAPEDRGQGLGLILKQANLARLRADHPHVHLVHTWTDPDNGPMWHINATLGFAALEQLHEMERHDD